MKEINLHNYEAFLLDYLEGTLSPELRDELKVFLENNPDIEVDLDASDLPKLTAPEVRFVEKETLKQGVITSNNYETFVIREVERLNTSDESQLLHTFLEKNPAYLKELDDYQKTKLIPPLVIFENKKALKKKSRIILIGWSYAAAACLFLFFSIKQLNNGKYTNELAKQNTGKMHAEVIPEKETIEEAKTRNKLAPKVPVKKEADTRSSQISAIPSEKRKPKNVTPAVPEKLLESPYLEKSKEEKLPTKKEPIEPSNITTIRLALQEEKEDTANVNTEEKSLLAETSNNTTKEKKDKDEYLSLGGFLKKQLFKRIGHNPKDANEVAVVSALATIAGKKGQLTKKQTLEEETIAYTLSVGNISWSRKVLKK